MMPPTAIEKTSPPSAPSMSAATSIELLTQKIRQLEGRLEGAESANRDLARRLRNSDDELRAQRAAVEKTREERDQMTRRVATLNKTIEERNATIEEVARSKAAITPMELHHLQTRIEDLEREKATVDQVVAENRALKATIERQAANAEAWESLKERQAQELYRLREELKKLRANPSRSSGNGLDPAVVKEFFKVRDAFRLLWESKAMKADDVLKQLLEWKGSE
jgi:chromosome segregation ATPase